MPTTVNIGNNTGNSGGITDVALDSPNPNDNRGGIATNIVGSDGAGREFRLLQRFDLSTIPAGSTATAATLYLYDTNWANRTANATLTLYKISDANNGWVEGTGTPTAQAGSSSWGYRVYNTTAWAGSGGLSTATTDYVNTSLGSASFTDGVSGYRTIALNADGLTVLNGWFGASNGNGLLMVGSGTGAYWTELVSKEGADAQRPYLAITYTTGGASVLFPNRGRIVNAGGMGGLHRGSIVNFGGH